MIRTELDALPVEEKTGLDYASTVKTTNAQGQQVSVMHACGHDLHMTVLLGAAREMAERKSQWHGTLMLIGQPAEEVAQGAAALLADHLYERFGRPDFVLSEHDTQRRGRRLDCAERRAAAGQQHQHQCDHPRHRRTRLRAAGGQGSHRAGRGVCAGGADHRQPADRSAAAGGADRGHHSRRHKEQHHSRRGDDGPHAADLFARRSATRLLRTSAAPRRDWRRHMGFPQTACRR